MCQTRRSIPIYSTVSKYRHHTFDQNKPALFCFSHMLLIFFGERLNLGLVTLGLSTFEFSFCRSSKMGISRQIFFFLQAQMQMACVMLRLRNVLKSCSQKIMLFYAMYVGISVLRLYYILLSGESHFFFRWIHLFSYHFICDNTFRSVSFFNYRRQIWMVKQIWRFVKHWRRHGITWHPRRPLNSKVYHCHGLFDH